MARRSERLTDEMMAEAGLSDKAIRVAKVVNNVALATALVAVDDDDSPLAPETVADFLAASRDMEGKALTRYLKLKVKYGNTLESAHAEYLEHRTRTGRLFAMLTGTLDAKPTTAQAADSGESLE